MMASTSSSSSVGRHDPSQHHVEQQHDDADGCPNSSNTLPLFQQQPQQQLLPPPYKRCMKQDKFKFLFWSQQTQQPRHHSSLSSKLLSSFSSYPAISMKLVCRSFCSIVFCILATVLHARTIYYTRHLYSLPNETTNFANQVVAIHLADNENVPTDSGGIHRDNGTIPSMPLLGTSDTKIATHGKKSASSVQVWPPKSMIEDIIVASNDYQQTRQKRIVIAASNAEYVDFADNFAHSLLRQNVTNFLLVPLDDTTYHILKQAYPKHTIPTFPSAKSQFQTTTSTTPNNERPHEITFGSLEFQQLTASRPNFLRRILELNYTILYNDIDMVWKQNAWDIIDERSTTKPKTATDSSATDPQDTISTSPNHHQQKHKPQKEPPPQKKSNPIIVHDDDPITTMLWHDGPNQICTCMLYMVPTYHNIQLLQGWENEIMNGNYVSDQDAFVSYIDEHRIVHLSPSATTYSKQQHTLPHHHTNGKKNPANLRIHPMSNSTTTAETNSIIMLYINDGQFPHGRKYNWDEVAKSPSASSVQQQLKPLTSSTTTSRKTVDWNNDYAVIVHNNWIKGKQAKKERFIRVGLWNPSGLL
jgi:hypothetical protein